MSGNATRWPGNPAFNCSDVNWLPPFDTLGSDWSERARTQGFSQKNASMGGKRAGRRKDAQQDQAHLTKHTTLLPRFQRNNVEALAMEINASDLGLGAAHGYAKSYRTAHERCACSGAFHV